MFEKINIFEKINRIKAWQDSPLTHSLTCGDCSGEQDLYPVIGKHGGVELRCHECGYTQYNIPPCCYKMSVAEIKLAEKDMDKLFPRKE